MASNRSRPGGARGPPPSLGRAMPAPLPSSSSSSSSSFPGSSSSAPGSSASSFPGSSSAGAGTTTSSNSNASPRFPRIRARYAQLKGTRAFRTIAFVNAHRRGFFGGAVLLYLGSSYLSAAVHARKRDRIHPSSYLYWKIYDGGIVEAKSSANVLSNLLFTSGGGGSDEPARIMTIFDVVKTLSWAARDDRIKGIIADFSSLSSPAVQSPYSLGLAQIEEICDAVEELNTFKNERLGAENWRSIAFTDTFDSQGQYALASSFQEIYVQPTGEVPLTGLGSQLPFFKRLIDWLGITVQAEAREEYKSFIAQYTSEKLSAPQTENQLEIMNSLNDLMLGRIARNRYSVGPATLPLDSDASSSAQGLAAESVETASNQPLTLASPLETSEVPTSSRVSPEGDETKEIGAHSTTAAEADAALPKADAALPKSLTVGGDAALQKMRDITMGGPYSAKEAAENGLITGISYRQYVLDSVLEAEHGGSEDNKLMGFYHYHRVMNRAMARSKEPIMDVGVVYLMGTIGESGDFDAGSVVRGLRQAGEDDDIGCVVLRIDSGGGGVVDSDSIDQAVRDLREKKGKVVIASFSNAAASGGYLAACHTDAIMAHASTLTGSIGVAALRPSFTPTFTDKLKVTVQSILTGSDYSDLTKELTGPNLAKYKMHVDEMYDDFKSRVVEGREMHPDMIQHLAGGRVYTGQMAFDMLEEVNKNRPAVEDLPGTVRLPHSGASQQKQDTPSTAASKAGEGVQLAEGQEMSPFSVVEEPVEAADAISTGSSEAVSLESGPLGRGIVDGLGGIRDAAALAAEVYLTRSLAALKLEKPGITDAEAIQEILPGMKFEVDDQKVVVPIDVDLKQFPVEKSFWQLYKEMANKGDAINDPGHAGGPSSMVNLIKVAVAGWVLSSAAKVLTEEMDSLGLADVRRAMGVGSRSRGRAYMRAEAPRWSGIR